MLKKIGIPVLALAALFVLFTPTPAAAQTRFGAGIYTAPPVCAYPGYYDPYCYAAPYSPYYYGYSYPYPYSYYYGRGYGYYGGGFRGGREFRAPERGFRGGEFRGGGGFRGNQFRGGGGGFRGGGGGRGGGGRR